MKRSMIGWNKISFGVQAETGAKRTEVLWMNYDPPGQLSLL